MVRRLTLTGHSSPPEPSQRIMKERRASDSRGWKWHLRYRVKERTSFRAGVAPAVVWRLSRRTLSTVRALSFRCGEFDDSD